MADTYQDTGAEPIYASKMPSLNNDADIQKAIKAYHYGTQDSANPTFTPSWTDPDYGALGKFLHLKATTDTLDSTKLAKSLFAAKGDILSASASSTPSVLSAGTNGFILKANSSTSTGLEWYNLDTTHLSLDPSSQTIVGDVTVSKASPILRMNATSGDSLINIEGTAGTYRGFRFRTGTTSRWAMYANNVAESGSDAGSNFELYRISDAGSATLAMSITRSTGLTTLTSLTVSGTMTGTLTGNASTATTLQTARNINGVSFNGSADITVTAAAGTLSGTTLNATVVSSSLTSVGTIGTGTWQGSVVAGQYGGTGVANTGKTITLGGNLVTSGAYGLTLTLTGTSNVTMPTTGTVATTSDVSTAINNLINSAPGALDTLDELAAALGDDPNFATTITNSLALKAPLASPTFTGLVTTAASTTGGAGLRLPLGVDPTTPTHGDIWTTTTDVRAYVNGSTVVLAQVTGGSPVVSASDINAGILSPTYGGTGVNNGVKTLTLSGNTTIGSGTDTVAFATAGATSVTLPTSGTLATLTSPTFVTSVLTSSTTFSVFNTTATTVNAFGAATNLQLGAATGTTTVRNGLTVTGNLTVNGTTTTVNSTTMTVDDPIITLGGDTAPGSDDNKDRGVEFRYYSGGGSYTGFFGWDDSTGKFTFLSAATNTSEVFSGTKGSIDAYFSGSDINTGLVAGTYGGTGVNNSGKTITLGGNLTLSGANSLTFTTTASTNVTLPTSGTLVSTSTTTLDSLVGIDTASTTTHTVNIGTGATSSGQTKTINIGKNGVSGSDTDINIGSNYGGYIRIGHQGMSGGTAAKYISIGQGGNPNQWTWINGGVIELRPQDAMEYPFFVMPHGSTPSTYLEDGGMWSTTSGLFMHVNGTTQQVAFLANPTFTTQASISSTTNATLNISANASGDSGNIYFQTNGENKWRIVKDTVGETGGNAGSDLKIIPHDDDGVALSTAIKVTRATGQTTLASLDVTGDTTVVDLTVSGVLRDTVTANSQADSYTLVLADRGKMIECTKATANTVTIPTNASVAFPVGTRIDVLQVGAGQVTIGGAGVTINGTPGLKLRAQWSSCTLIKRATNTWVVVGDLTA